MRTLPSVLADRVATGNFTGSAKATTRVTVQKVNLGIYGSGSSTFASLVFQSGTDPARELPNLKRVSWSRAAEQDTGSATIELFNTEPLPPGSPPQVGDVFDLLGYFTYNRGKTAYAQNTWGHRKNQWQDFLVPDRVVRVYQGYGVDRSKTPEEDPNLLLMGVFLIDDVTYTADGVITLDCRDNGRLLSDQIMSPPVVPLPSYPLLFETIRQVKNPDTKVATSWTRPQLDGSSNGAAAAQFGHHPTHAFDASTTSYWLSTGYDVSNHPSSYVWLSAKRNGRVPLGGVRVSVRGGPYRVYLSVYTDKAAGGKITGWNGSVKIPYVKAATLPDNGSKIPYSKTAVARANATTDITFPAVKGVTKFRLTFTHLHDSKHQPHPFRAAVRDVQMTDNVSVKKGVGTHPVGNYSDYTDIVKILLAWGGFYWPQDGSQVLTNGNRYRYHFTKADAVIKTGRIWGDIQTSGVAGQLDSPLGVEIWDKKPVIDGINYVKDVLGYNFFVDETGGAIFRSPNTFRLGNWKVDSAGLNGARTTDYVTLYDDRMILGLRSKLSSRNLREHVFVANVDGKHGRTARGRIAYPSGFRRVGMWTDLQNLKEADLQIMADLITLRQLFTYRQDSVRIPANPAIQVDDQIKIFERTTGEAYFHYVSAISSEWDLDSGAWTYDLTTSWLGENPSAEWAFATTGLDAVTQQYLKALNQLPPEGNVSTGRAG